MLPCVICVGLLLTAPVRQPPKRAQRTTMNYPTHPNNDPWTLLGIKPTNNLQDIQKAFRAQARRWHPDRNQEANAQGRFQSLLQAYEQVSDESERAAWFSSNIPSGGLDWGSSEARVMSTDDSLDGVTLFGEGRARQRASRQVGRSTSAASQREAMERARAQRQRKK